jgi:hypothetical protein
MNSGRIWGFVIVLLTYLPWLVIAAAAAIAFFRNKSTPRPPLLLQILGAAGAFLLGVGRWGILLLLDLSNAPFGLYSGAGTVLTFLVFLAELVFAAGFAWEKLSRARATPAFPVTSP